MGVVLLFAAWVRIADLGHQEFNGDELDHVYAARSLAQGDGPVLPSGNRYDRAVDFTRLVGWTSSWSDDPEQGARLGSAAFGWLAVVAFAVVVWLLLGPWPAVWAALILALYPEAIAQSRQVRFYTYQLLLAVIAFGFGWKGFAASATGAVGRSVLWSALALATLAVAARVQVTTLSVVAGWLSATVVIGLVDGVFGRTRWRRNVPLLSGAAVILLASTVVVARPTILADAWTLARYVPQWAGGVPGDPRAYYWQLNSALPVLVALGPVAYVVLALERPRLALYALCWFAVPFFLHSFAFAWKGERYLLSAIPGLFLPAGYAIARGLGALRVAVERGLLRSGIGAPAPVAGVVTVVVALGAVVATPGFNEARRLPTHRPETWWSVAQERIVEVDETPLVASSVPLPALYYIGRLDMVVGSDFLERSQGTPGQTVLAPESSPDWYSGAPVLVTPRTMGAAVPPGEDLFVAIDLGRWQSGNITDTLRRVLEREAEELCRGACGALLVFRWTPRQEPDRSVDRTTRAAPGSP